MKKTEKTEKMRVKLTKINKAKNPVVKTAKKKGYVCGSEQDEEVSPFVGYWVIGTLERPIEIGKAIRMIRENRNGVECLGLFLSSVVKSIKGNIVETDNSVYEMEEIKG